MLHNTTVDLNKVKSNLEEALESQLRMMQQNSGRAGQFAPMFVSIFEAVEKIDWVIRDKLNKEKEAAKATKKTDNKEVTTV